MTFTPISILNYSDDRILKEFDDTRSPYFALGYGAFQNDHNLDIISTTHLHMADAECDDELTDGWSRRREVITTRG